MQYMEEEIMEIRFEERKQLKENQTRSILVFGKYMTDYMFCYGLEQRRGMVRCQIVPQGPIELEPACVTLHCTGDI